MDEEKDNQKKEDAVEEGAAINWEAKAGEYLDGWKRAMADYMNREKEIAKERDRFRYIIEDAAITDFLPVLDNLKNALSAKTEDSPVWQGIMHVIKQFEDVLKSLGYEKIDILGKDFDATLCEAAEKQGEGNKILKVVLDGYKKGDRIVRAARVVVG
jgi:molecular chaperone GrpE